MNLENSKPRKLEKHTGEVHEAHLSNERVFAGGAFAKEISEVTSTIRQGENERDIELVIKKYNKPENAEKALHLYQLAKEAHLKVPPTYRLDREHGDIVMTSYNTHDRVAITANDNRLAPRPKHTSAIARMFTQEFAITNIQNFDRLMSDLEEQCKRASLHHILIPADAYFLIVPRSGGAVDADFVIGDLDALEQCHEEDSEEGIEILNRRNGDVFIRRVMKLYGGEKFVTKKLGKYKPW